MSESTRLRVLHCPANIGGHPQGLVEAERSRGIASRCVEFPTNPYGFHADEQLWGPADSRLSRERKRWKFLRSVLREYDIVHFNFGRTFLPQRWPRTTPELLQLNPIWRLLYSVYACLFELRDLAWLKKKGLGIVMTYQGDDARQADFCRERFDVTAAKEVSAGYYPEGSDDYKRRRIRKVGKYADQIYALNPDLLHVLPPTSEFLPYAQLDLREPSPIDPPLSRNTKPVILHAPTNRDVKGTKYILQAVETLRRADGLEFEFRLIEGLRHSDAMQVYSEADLLIDQLLIGWYGGLALELMSMGRPVISYIRESDLVFLPQEMREGLPVITASPKTIYSVLKEWLTVRYQHLPQRGQESLEWIRRWHCSSQVSKRTVARYREIMSTTRPAA